MSSVAGTYSLIHLVCSLEGPQCSRKTFIVHQTFVWWAWYILFKFVKSLIRHLGLANGNVQHVRWFSRTLGPLLSSSSYLTHYGSRSILVQVIACYLYNIKPLSEKCWFISNWTIGNKLQRNFNQNTTLFIQENALNDVICHISGILVLPQSVKTGSH